MTFVMFVVIAVLVVIREPLTTKSTTPCSSKLFVLLLRVGLHAPTVRYCDYVRAGV